VHAESHGPGQPDPARLAGSSPAADLQARQLENAKISQPKVHDGAAAIARPVGVGEVSKVDADSGPKPSGDVNDPPAADKAKDQPSAKPPETPKPS